MSRRRLVGVGAWAVLVTGGCFGPENDPESEYRAALSSFYSGDLAGAYDRLCPASYDRDLNLLLDKLQRLIDPESFQEALELMGTLAALWAPDADSPDAWIRQLSRVMSDLPSHSGLASYEDFRHATVRSLLQQIQRGELWAVLRRDDSPVQVTRQWLLLEERRSNEAEMRVVPAGDDSPDRLVMLVLIEGKWLPQRMAQGWEKGMTRANARLDAWLLEKERDPEFLEKRLTQLRGRAFELALTLSGFLQQVAPTDPVASR